MNQAIKNFIISAFKGLGVGIARFDTLQKLRHDTEHLDKIEFLLAISNMEASQLFDKLKKTKSQFRQDLFVLTELGFKRNGFFVEFGATNGVDISNTYLMEKEFAWTGILAEPARCWHEMLYANRSAFIETNCVWSKSNSVLSFKEVHIPDLSTINSFSSVDGYKNTRRTGKIYDVRTISLNDLLEKYQAPHRMDYLSIDTEGSEFEILNSFDFGKYQFDVITCEHNFTPMREKIFELLSKNGYVRKYQELSKADDWYVRTDKPSQ